jgi:phosphatidylinositol alpha 1,6-mannosyltransferase
MRIGIVTESFLPQVNGVTNSVLRILEFLAEEGHQALVIAPESAGGPTEYFGHRVKRIPSLPLQSILPIGLPVAVPRRKLEFLIDGFAPDILHLASPFVLGGYSARIAKRLNIPTLSVYQTDIAGFATHYGMTMAHAGLRKIVSKIHSNTNRTLAPSSSAKNELVSQGVQNVHLWRRGVNTKLFHPDKRDENLYQQWLKFREIDAKSNRAEKLVVGYVGRLANEKRISDLQILDRDQLIQLVITGEGPARPKLERELPNAIFTGFQSGEELARIYASLDLFIHPGPNETFCQAVQEALSSGTPCVVPKTGGPADLVTHGTTGYIIDTSNPFELQSAVTHFRLRNDREFVSEISRDSVVERTWNRVNNQLMMHYRSILEPAKPRLTLTTGSAA